MMQNKVKETQSHIEQCLRNFLNKEETVYVLESQVKIAPKLTAAVWDKMEELHPDFFQAYKLKRRIADQILAYNHLHKSFKELDSRTKNNSSQLAKNEFLSTSKPILTRNSYQNMLNIAKEKSHQNREDAKENFYPNLPPIRVMINGGSQPAKPLQPHNPISTHTSSIYSQPMPTLSSLVHTSVVSHSLPEYESDTDEDVENEAVTEPVSEPIKPNLHTLLEAAADLDEDGVCQ